MGLQQNAIVPSDIVSRPTLTQPGVVTAFVGLSHSTGSEFPLPLQDPIIASADVTILIIGGFSNAGLFAIQLTHMARFKRILTPKARRPYRIPSHSSNRHFGEEVQMIQVGSRAWLESPVSRP